MGDFPGLLAGTLVLRPYVFLFLLGYGVAAVAAWGVGRTVAFTLLAAGLAFIAEWTSTRIGVPFGLYQYTGVTRGRELYLDNVPFFDPLSFAFLAWASLGVARFVTGRSGTEAGPGNWLALGALTGALMTWLDLVIDPLAVRGDRWFLGPVFYYPEPGPYFGVPLANFVGWAALGTVIAAIWLRLEPSIPGGRSTGSAARSAGVLGPIGLYYGVLGFNLVLTAAVAEWTLLASGLLLQAPLAALVVSCLTARRRAARGARRAVESNR